MNKQNSQIIGISWMLLHCLLISVLVTMAKFLGSQGFATMQIVFCQSFVGFVLLLPFALRQHGLAIVKTKHLKLHFIRAALGATSLFLYFYALKFIPLTDGRAIALFNPVITFIFAVIFLKEAMDIKKAAMLLLALIGGYVIINPNSVSFHIKDPYQSSFFFEFLRCLKTSTAHVPLSTLRCGFSNASKFFEKWQFAEVFAMSLLVVAAMFMWSAIDLIIKKISKDEPNLRQLFFFMGLMSLLSLPFA
ncbi:MAG: DMT family transporter, partial [Proteobacteria bacterium]|nr:DMT family transporter [Pseudomonadota bacterium]